jgi:hypothetical protein
LLSRLGFIWAGMKGCQALGTVNIFEDKHHGQAKWSMGQARLNYKTLAHGDRKWAYAATNIVICL